LYDPQLLFFAVLLALLHGNMVYGFATINVSGKLGGWNTSTEETETNWIGLQFRCNQNFGNEVNILSRKASNATQQEQYYHTIRGYQGNPPGQYMAISAHNKFDQTGGGNFDFKVETTYALITYHHRTGTGLKPMFNSPDYFATSELASGGYYCPAVVQPGTTVPSTGQVKMLLQQEKEAYGNTRYLYGQLIDGGSTDDVVEEIISSWPQDAWDLREYLLSRSPYLSVEVLYEMVERNIMPDAMVTEICIANPDGTSHHVMDTTNQMNPVSTFF
jgi:hypothetical protein